MAAWQERGNCRVWLDRTANTPDERRELLADYFFPRTRAHPKGRPLCANCPVAFECLLEAFDNRERFGLFGGATEGQRRELLRRARSIGYEEAAAEWIDRLDRAYEVNGRPEPAEMRHGTPEAFGFGCRCRPCYAAAVKRSGRCQAKTGLHRKRTSISPCGQAAVPGRHLCPWHLKVSDSLLEDAVAG